MHLVKKLGSSILSLAFGLLIVTLTHQLAGRILKYERVKFDSFNHTQVVSRKYPLNYL